MHRFGYVDVLEADRCVEIKTRRNRFLTNCCGYDFDQLAAYSVMANLPGTLVEKFGDEIKSTEQSLEAASMRVSEALAAVAATGILDGRRNGRGFPPGSLAARVAASM